jgi:uncharacterized RDD family membrane protein YckC
MTDHSPDHDPNLDPDHDFEDLAHWEDEGAPLPESGPGALAPIWARGIARIVDLFIAGVGGMFVANLFGAISYEDDAVVIENQVTYALAILLVWGVYEVFGTIGGGRTVGKFLMGLRVRRIDADRAPAAFKALSRWLVMGVALLLPLGGLEIVVLLFVYLTALAHPMRQGIHDRLANTLVVRAR